MPKVPNTRKVFNFAIDINGLNQFECQKVTRPEVEIDQVEHGDVNYAVKTPGRLKYTNLILEKVRPVNADRWAWDWLTTAQDPILGSGQLPSSIKQIVTVRELAPNGGTISINTNQGCWVCKVSPGDYDRNSSDNIIQKVEISVDISTER